MLLRIVKGAGNIERESVQRRIAMVTVEEIKKRTFNTKLSDIMSKKREYQVSDAQMAPYLEDYAELALEISDIIEDYVEEHQLKPKLKYLIEDLWVRIKINVK